MTTTLDAITARHGGALLAEQDDEGTVLLTVIPAHAHNGQTTTTLPLTTGEYDQARDALTRIERNESDSATCEYADGAYLAIHAPHDTAGGTWLIEAFDGTNIADVYLEDDEIHLHPQPAA